MILRDFRFLLFATFLILLSQAVYGENPKLINIKKLAPNIIIDMRYATTNNFTGQKMYDSSECHLCEPAAKRLARVQKSLEKKGLGLKIWDCYRPLSIQQRLWDVVPDNRYVANPKFGSRHNRGASVDLTLVDSEGNELPMPTGFDDFSEKAHRDYTKLPKEILKNRNTLQEAMEKEGFFGLPTEWWHFDDPEWKNFALRDDPVGSASLDQDKKINITSLGIPSTVTQLVTVTSKSWKSKTAKLQRYERSNGKWEKIGKAWSVSLGKNGMGWGQGLHPASTDGPQKREGDKKATAGIYKIGQAYGYNKAGPDNSDWPYQQVTSKWRCIDDPKSSFYNKVLTVEQAQPKDWKSAEKMKRKDHIYKWVVNIEQNYPAVLKGAGSCIFFHVWRRKDAPTLGCTAMTEENIKELLSWMDPSHQPHLVQLPQPIYKKVKKSWKLPSL